MNNSIKKGILYIVSTPIGNLKDITLRALDILNEVDMIACEDTRNTLKLLSHFNIKKPLISYHEHNRFDKAKELIDELLVGKSIALVTDAGTPIISDPGDVLVKEAILNNIEVTALPGSCALINAAVLSGFNIKKFTFIGFLPDDKKDKVNILSNYKDREEALILYSSKSQIKKDIDIIYGIYGKEKNVTISREMTKIHEEIIRGDISYVKEYVKDKDLLGEFVICIEGLDKNIIEDREKEKWQNITIEEHVKQYMDQGFDEKEAIKKTSKDRSIDKNEVYKCIKIKEK